MIGAMVAAALGSRSGRAALRLGLPALAVRLFVLSLRRAGERAGRAVERLDILEKTHDTQCRMLPRFRLSGGPAVAALALADLVATRDGEEVLAASTAPSN